MGKFGTLSVLDDLATDERSVIEAEEFLAKRVAEALAVHNAAFAEMVSTFAFVTKERELPYGGGGEAINQELDEWGAADASKGGEAETVGLPLRIYGSTVQWTRTAFENLSVAKFAQVLDSHATADIKRFQSILRYVLFKNTNTADYVDRLDSKRKYNLYALLNADGMAIPESPNGTVFDGSTHTHYLATATLTEASLQAGIDTVVEHGVDGSLHVYIAKGNEAAVRQLTGFSPYLDSRITVIGAAQVGNQSLNVANPDNRAIGVFGGVEVWVKPWVPANYQVVVDAGASEKPLAIRTRTGDLTGAGSFRILADHEHFPLRAKNLGREYGVSVATRHKGAALRSNNATYAIPSGI